MKLHLVKDNINCISIAVDFLINQIKNNNLTVLEYIILLPTTFGCKLFKEAFAKKNNNISLFIPKVYTKQNLLDFFISQLCCNSSKELELAILTDLILKKYNKTFRSNIENIIELSRNILLIMQNKNSLNINNALIKNTCKYEYSEHFNFLIDKLDEIEQELSNILMQKQYTFSIANNNEIFYRILNYQKKYKYIIISGIYTDINLINFLKDSNANIFLNYNENFLYNKAYFFYISNLICNYNCKNIFELNNFIPINNSITQNNNCKNQNINLNDAKSSNIDNHHKKEDFFLDNNEENITNIINLIKKSNNIEFINFKSINDDYHIHNKIIKEKPSNRIKIIKYFAFQNINQDTLFICKKILDTIKNYKNKKIGILVSDNKTFEILKSNLEAFNINFHIAENRNKSTFIAFFISFLSLIFEFEISIFFSVLRNILNFFYFKKSSYKSQNFYFQIFQFEELAKQKFLFNQEDIIKELKLQNNKKFYFIRHFLKWINKIKRAQNIKTLLDMMFIFLNKVEKLNDSESLNINYNKQLQTQKLKILQLCSIILNAKISNIKTEIAVLKYLLHNIKTPSYNNSIKNLNNIEVNIFNSIKSLYMYDCDLIFLANLQYDIFKKEQYNSFLPPHIIKDLSLDLQEQENLYYFAQVFKKNIFITIQEDIAKNIHKISSLKFDIKSIINCEVIFKATTKNIIYDISQNIKNIFINENLHSQDSYNQVLNYNINHYIVYATHIEQYIKDKFAFYAEKILKLKINNEIKSIPEANIFGSIMHELIRYYFIEIRAKFIEDNNFNIVNTLVEQYFNAKSEILKNIYLNKALEVLNMFILYIYPNIIYKTNFIEHKYKVEEYNKCYSKISIKSDSNISNTFIEYYEHKIEASFKIDQNEYTLLAILDFLRINNNQKYLLVDYKTGVLPTKKDITTFKHTQLLTSAIIIILSNYSKLEKIIFNPKCNNEEIIKKIWNKFHQENKEIQISYIKLSNKIKSIKEVSVIISYEIFIEYIEFLINILLQINNSDIASFKNQDHEKYSLLL